MNSTSVETQAQKAAMATDATWDTEAQFSVENQINQDQGRSLGTTLQDVVKSSTSSSSTTVPSTMGTKSSSTSDTIPTGLDAIKAAGPQSKSRTEAYSEHK